MAKKNKMPKKVAAKESPSAKKSSKDNKTDINEKVTWEDIAAMSDSDDEEDGGDIGVAIGLNSKAKSLRQAIHDGKFDSLLAAPATKPNQDNDDDDDDFEEDVLDSSSYSNSDEEKEESDERGMVGADAEHDQGGKQASSEEEEDEEEEAMDEEEQGGAGKNGSNNDMEEEEDDDDEQETEEDRRKMVVQAHEHNNVKSAKALSVVTAAITASHSKLAWAETFVVVPPTPLPFGEKGDPESNPLDIHDDLKREVAFYNTALEAVRHARNKCNEADIPFSRPDDFFAEMVKTDDHMAKVKDRLIFETKKIEAVAQRKSNKEQKLRARESQANRVAEKAKRKREHFQQVEDWANSVAKQRGSALKDEMDEQFLSGGRNNNGPNKKRQAADRKFGYGGKKGRFKQNDKQSMNDMSGFNPKGSFAGGMKRTSGASKSGSGAQRQGKRARDAKRTKR